MMSPSAASPSRLASEAGQDLKGILDAAERALEHGPPIWWHVGVPFTSPDQWTPAEVRRARLLSRETPEMRRMIREHWAGLGISDRAEAERRGPTLAVPYDAWTGPVDPGAPSPRVVPGERLLLAAWSGFEGDSIWWDTYEIRALSPATAVLLAMGDGVPGGEPWYPVPAALLDRERILEGVGLALEDLTRDRILLQKPIRIMSCTVPATDLWRVLLFASGYADRGVFGLDVPDLAGIETPGAKWDLVDLITWIDECPAEVEGGSSCPT
jgi:hypothetical protein